MTEIIIVFVITAVVFFLLGRFTYKIKVRRIHNERLENFGEKYEKMIRTLPGILMSRGDFSDDEIQKCCDIVKYHIDCRSGTCLGILNSILSDEKTNFTTDEIKRYFEALECVMRCQMNLG